ncbi:MAG: hypothetical protein QOD55_2087, partial [Solirubrobacteraceae bacterium]|nr:hypothetical protein [Solirubrobacteraceae bacterium]
VSISLIGVIAAIFGRRLSQTRVVPAEG